MTAASRWQEVWDVVRQIPPGKVMNYGQVAQLLSQPLSARAVGWAMRDCPADVPWHRVVAASGACSADQVASNEPGRQRRRLQREGVKFDAGGHVVMQRYRWQPEDD